jgi:hypothetical protein
MIKKVKKIKAWLNRAEMLGNQKLSHGDEA